MCPGCGASWTVLGGMLPLPVRCFCSGDFEWHEAWRCRHCRVVLAQGCLDTDLWAHEYVPYGAVRLTWHPFSGVNRVGCRFSSRIEWSSEG